MVVAFEKCTDTERPIWEDYVMPSVSYSRAAFCTIIIIIIIIIKNEYHSNIIVDRLQGCGHSKKLRESESESRSSKVV